MKKAASLRDERKARMIAKIAVSGSAIGRHSAERASVAPANAMSVADLRPIPMTVNATDDKRSSVNNTSALIAEVNARPAGETAK